MAPHQGTLAPEQPTASVSQLIHFLRAVTRCHRTRDGQPVGHEGFWIITEWRTGGQVQLQIYVSYTHIQWHEHYIYIYTCVCVCVTCVYIYNYILGVSLSCFVFCANVVQSEHHASFWHAMLRRDGRACSSYMHVNTIVLDAYTLYYCSTVYRLLEEHVQDYPHHFT